MNFKTKLFETAARSVNGRIWPKSVPMRGTLSQQELQRVVAEMLG